MQLAVPDPARCRVEVYSPLRGREMRLALPESFGPIDAYKGKRGIGRVWYADSIFDPVNAQSRGLRVDLA